MIINLSADIAILAEIAKISKGSKLGINITAQLDFTSTPMSPDYFINLLVVAVTSQELDVEFIGDSPGKEIINKLQNKLRTIGYQENNKIFTHTRKRKLAQDESIPEESIKINKIPGSVASTDIISLPKDMLFTIFNTDPSGLKSWALTCKSLYKYSRAFFAKRVGNVINYQSIPKAVALQTNLQANNFAEHHTVLPLSENKILLGNDEKIELWEINSESRKLNKLAEMTHRKKGDELKILGFFGGETAYAVKDNKVAIAYGYKVDVSDTPEKITSKSYLRVSVYSIKNNTFEKKFDENIECKDYMWAEVIWLGQQHLAINIGVGLYLASLDSNKITCIPNERIEPNFNSRLRYELDILTAISEKAFLIAIERFIYKIEISNAETITNITPVELDEWPDETLDILFYRGRLKLENSIIGLIQDDFGRELVKLFKLNLTNDEIKWHQPAVDFTNCNECHLFYLSKSKFAFVCNYDKHTCFTVYDANFQLINMFVINAKIGLISSLENGHLLYLNKEGIGIIEFEALNIDDKFENQPLESLPVLKPKI